MPPSDMFDDLDEQGDQLLGLLHLGPAEEEPVRRCATSRANSVRFDESALHGANLGGHGNRPSSDFGPFRPSSSLMMERTFSHKSDGRHSSAGHSVHSHHSVPSGRASSLGLENNFAAGDDSSSSLDVPAPPASLYVLGSVPSIVRCWLTTHYAHDTLLYADVCTGSQKSTVDYSLLKELDLLDEIQRDMAGVHRARLNVYLAEAVVTQASCGRNGPSQGSVPSMTVFFEVTGMEPLPLLGERGAIRIYIGSDALRAHSADVLFSQNLMALYGNERDRLQVPFVRPEDDAAFRHIYTATMTPEKPKLNANATPFIFRESRVPNGELAGSTSPASHQEEGMTTAPSISSTDSQAESQNVVGASAASDQFGASEKPGTESVDPDGCSVKDGSTASETSRRESSSAAAAPGIWGSWRQGAGSGADGAAREGGPLSGYQPAARGGRNMKVLRPLKSSSSTARTGTSCESPLSSKLSSDGRRRSQASLGGDGGTGSANGTNRWESKRSTASSAEPKLLTTGRESRMATAALPVSANPVGVASAFSWMTPPSKTSKTSTGAGA